MRLAYLDCSREVSESRKTPPTRLNWLAHEISPADWRLPVDETAVAEIDALAETIDKHPGESLAADLAGSRLSACVALMARMKSILDQGVGFAVLDRLDLEQYPIEIMLTVYRLLGTAIGRPVAQKWNGQMLYEVRDTGTAYGYGTRGSHTAVELNFHTDNAFARVLPDYVGLLCRRPAKLGGISRFCSLYAIHQCLEEDYPRALERLYQPMLFDRQQEHAPDDAPVCLAPFFSWRGDRLFARANATLVRQGYGLAGVEMDSALVDALAAIDEVCARDEFWYQAPIERGQIQYLNNHEIGHYRSAFVDHDQPELKRHLYRLWHRDDGEASYDGL